jgi:hypothetical protein
VGVASKCWRAGAAYRLEKSSQTHQWAERRLREKKFQRRRLVSLVPGVVCREPRWRRQRAALQPAEALVVSCCYPLRSAEHSREPCPTTMHRDPALRLDCGRPNKLSGLMVTRCKGSWNRQDHIHCGEYGLIRSLSSQQNARNARHRDLTSAAPFSDPTAPQRWVCSSRSVRLVVSDDLVVLGFNLKALSSGGCTPGSSPSLSELGNVHTRQ